jgi:hypothetical protein
LPKYANSKEATNDINDINEAISPLSSLDAGQLIATAEQQRLQILQ